MRSLLAPAAQANSLTFDWIGVVDLGSRQPRLSAISSPSPRQCMSPFEGFFRTLNLTTANAAGKGETMETLVRFRIYAASAAAVLSILGSSGCSKALSDAIKQLDSKYTVGGTVTGLTGSGLVLEDNATDDLAVSADGAFTFAAALMTEQSYKVTVKTQPSNPQQTCTVS